MTSPHLDRKELKRPDAFMAKASSLFEVIQRNGRAVLVSGIVVLLLAGALTLFSVSQTKHAAKAGSAFYVAKTALATALEKTPKTAANWQDTVKDQLGQVEKITQDYKGTQAAFEAALLLGDVYTDRDINEKAVEHYKRAVELAPSRNMKAFAQHALAYAHEDAKQTDAAIEQLRSALASGEKSFRGDILMALARNHAIKGDAAKAREHYDQITKEFPNTALAKTAEAHKNSL